MTKAAEQLAPGASTPHDAVTAEAEATRNSIPVHTPVARTSTISSGVFGSGFTAPRAPSTEKVHEPPDACEHCWVRVPAAGKVTASRIRITLDTSKIAGWNEIDAVELVGQDGSRQWATDARASSTYATATGAVGPLDGLVGKRVKLRVGGETLRGTLKAQVGGFLTVDTGVGEVLVNLARLDWIGLE